jgi:hypothetical protein
MCSVSLPLASGYGYCHAPFFYDGFDLHQGAIIVSAVAAAADQTIEGIELDRGIVPARMQSIEIGDTVDAQQHRLAVNDERAVETRTVCRHRSCGRSSPEAVA